VRVIDDTDHTHRQFDTAPMLSAARLLADAKVDVIAWNGTSGAWEGIDQDRRLVEAIKKELGVPATTTTLALIDLMSTHQLHTYGLVVPYVDSIIDKITFNFRAEGLQCVASSSDKLTNNFSFAEVDAATIASRIREVAAQHPDAIVVHCTNLRGADVATEMAQELGVPILDSVVVTLWGALRMLGETAELPGLVGLGER
jgi:maleate isomerase